MTGRRISWLFGAGFTVMAALVIPGCAAPETSPAASRPIAGAAQFAKAIRPSSKTGTALPVYVLKTADVPGEPRTFFTRFAAAEAEPEKAGQPERLSRLEPFELPSEGMAKKSGDQVSLWLYATLELPHALSRVTLKSCAAGASQIYLNGKLIYSGGQTPRPFKIDADVVPGIDFKAGKNLLVVHVQNTTSKWRLALRFFSPDGFPLLWSVRNLAPNLEARQKPPIR